MNEIIVNLVLFSESALVPSISGCQTGQQHLSVRFARSSEETKSSKTSIHLRERCVMWCRLIWLNHQPYHHYSIVGRRAVELKDKRGFSRNRVSSTEKDSPESSGFNPSSSSSTSNSDKIESNPAK